MDRKSKGMAGSSEKAWRPVLKRSTFTGDANPLSGMGKVIGQSKPAQAAPVAQQGKGSPMHPFGTDVLQELVHKGRLLDALELRERLVKSAEGVAHNWMEPNETIDTAMDEIYASLVGSATTVVSENEGFSSTPVTLAGWAAVAFRCFIDRHGHGLAVLKRLAEMAKSTKESDRVLHLDRDLFYVEHGKRIDAEVPADIVAPEHMKGAQEVARLMADGTATGPGRLARDFMRLQGKLNDGVPWKDGEVEIYEGSWFFVAVSTDGRRYEFGWGPTWCRQREEREMLAAAVQANFELASLEGRLMLERGESDSVLWQGKNWSRIEISDKPTRRGMSLEITVKGDGVDHARRWIAQTMVPTLWPANCWYAEQSGALMETTKAVMLDRAYQTQLQSPAAKVYMEALEQRRQAGLKV